MLKRAHQGFVKFLSHLREMSLPRERTKTSDLTAASNGRASTRRSKRPLQRRRVINSPQSFLPDFYFFPLIIRVFHNFSFLRSLPPRGTGSQSNQGHIQEQNIKGSILVPHRRENIGELGEMKQITHPDGSE